MKMRLLLSTILFGSLAAPAFPLDQVFLESPIPNSPVLKAQGGVSTANAEGYQALFINPAAFSVPKPSLTILSLESTANMPLSGLTRILEARNSWTNLDYLSGTNPMRTLLNDLLTQYGLGFEESIGSGWVGNNLGLGMVVKTQVMAKGDSLLETKSTVDSTLEGVVGMAWPFDVGLGTLRVGAALRPMQINRVQLSVSDILDHMADINGYTISSGFGLGWDLGFRWDYSGFRTGLAIRDAGSTVVNFKDYTGSKWVSGFGFPAGGTSTGNTLYRIPTVIALGTNWTPDVGTLANLFQPSLSFDLQIPIKDENTQPSFWTWTHLGAEAKFLQFLSVRTGLNQGYFTFGLGAKVFFTDFNLAIYSDELGRFSGLNRRSGISFEWAFRI
jgi:hypothetical protein